MKALLINTSIGMGLAYLGMPLWIWAVIAFGYIFLFLPFIIFKMLFKLGIEDQKEKERIKNLSTNSKEYQSRYMPKTC